MCLATGGKDKISEYIKRTFSMPIRGHGRIDYKVSPIPTCNVLFYVQKPTTAKECACLTRKKQWKWGQMKEESTITAEKLSFLLCSADPDSRHPHLHRSFVLAIYSSHMFCVHPRKKIKWTRLHWMAYNDENIYVWVIVSWMATYFAEWQ